VDSFGMTPFLCVKGGEEAAIRPNLIKKFRFYLRIAASSPHNQNEDCHPERQRGISLSLEYLSQKNISQFSCLLTNYLLYL